MEWKDKMPTKRSGKFYRKNESEVMKQLGFTPTPNSGSGWVSKEDGENENCLCQLKSTDANSIKINKLDIDKLIYHSNISKKLPVFAIQFLESNEVLILLRPEDITDIANYIDTGKKPNKESLIQDVGVTRHKNKKIIKSSSNARDEFNELIEEKFRKKMRSAK